MCALVTAHNLEHVGSNSLTRDRTWGPLHQECGALATRLSEKSLSCLFLIVTEILLLGYLSRQR